MFCPVCRAEYPADWKVCPKDATSLLASPKIGKYTIEGLIGVGGMGAVYRASNPDTKSEVAIKIMNANVAGSADARQRFQREASAVAKLKTAHVVKVNDFGTEADGTLYLVMELLDGHNLRDEILEPPALIDLARVQFVMEGALKGLAAAHKAGIVHRDLKPENIFIAQTDDGEVAKLLDFGIARVESVGTDLTRTGTMMGTASYMAPEQVSGNTAEIGPWTDVYAMGAILYELLTGVLAFGGASITEVLTKVLQSEVVPLRTRRAGLPDAIYALVERCLTGDRTARPASAEELRVALAGARIAPLGATIPNALTRREVASGVAPTVGVTGAEHPSAPPVSSSPPVRSASPIRPVEVAPTAASALRPVTSATAPPPSSPRRVVLGATLGGGGVIAIGVGAYLALRSHGESAKPTPAPPVADLVAATAPADATGPLDATSSPDARVVAHAPELEPDPLATFSISVDGDIASGPADAKVTLVVAGEDYACPYCEKLRPTLVALRAKYGSDLRIVHKAFVAHRNVTAAALATCAAAKQGKYEQLAELLWDRSYKSYRAAGGGPSEIARNFDAYNCWATRAADCSMVTDLAKETGLDVARFHADMVACIDSVARDQQQLTDVGVVGIPTTFVNGRYITGARPVEGFIPLIEEELHKAEQRIRQGTPKKDYYQRWVVDAGVKPGGRANPSAPTSGGQPAPPDVASPPLDASRTAKGVFYKLLERGTGDRHPAPTDTVQVNYTGWTTDGHLFDSSAKHGRPAVFPLTNVIPGWTDGLQVMVVGDRTRFWIPAALAYGDREGAPRGMLVFDIELLAITPR